MPQLLLCSRLRNPSIPSLTPPFLDTHSLHLVLRLRGGGKVHGSLARAGKVKGQTPKVAPQEKSKLLTGRAKKRLQYNRRYVNASSSGMGKKVGPNNNQARIAREQAALEAGQGK